MDIKGSVAFVTGGASGLGAGMVQKLVDEGAKIAIFDRDADKGIALAAKYGDSTLFFAGDITQEEPVQAAIDATVAAWGDIGICVHCAGVGGFAPVADENGPQDLEIFRDMITINLVGTFNVNRLIAARMIKNAPDPQTGERGIIINTTSIAGMEAQAGMIAYGASKAGVIGMTLPLTRDLSAWGIRACAIAPGFFDSALTEGMDEGFRDYLLNLNEFPKTAGQPSMFASLAAEIIRNIYMNGEVIRLDGGTRAPPRFVMPD